MMCRFLPSVSSVFTKRVDMAMLLHSCCCRLLGVDVYHFDFKLYHIAQHVQVGRAAQMGKKHSVRSARFWIAKCGWHGWHELPPHHLVPCKPV